MPHGYCSLGPVPPKSGTTPGPGRQRYCAVQASRKNSFTFGFDVASVALSFVPGGGIVRTVGVTVASVGLTTPSTVFSALQHHPTEAAITFTAGVLTNPPSVLLADQFSMTVAKALPFVGSVVSAGELVYDSFGAYTDYQNCMGHQ